MRKVNSENLIISLELKKSKEHYVSLLKKSNNMQARLKHLSQKLIMAQEDERKKISHELHDEISQILLGINLKLATLSSEISGNEKGIKRKILIAQKLVKKSVEKIHTFARELRPSVLDDLGIIPALRSYIDDFTKRNGITVALKASLSVEKLDSIKKTVLYRIVQESLINVEKHSKASNVNLKIQKIKDHIHMEIKDNGRSFDVEKMLFSKKGKGIGILGMRERIEMVEGTFYIESVLGKGTVIRTSIPS